MIQALSKKLANRNSFKLRDANKNILKEHDLTSNLFGITLTQVPKFYILQGAKRLQTFSIPQQEEIKPIDKEIFNDAALRTLIRIESGFQRILESEHNQISRQKIKQIIKKGLYSFQVVSDKGSFQFEAVADLSTLFYTSPITGAYKYFYSLEDQKFLNNKDKHQLEENVSREVLDKLYFVLEL